MNGWLVGCSVALGVLLLLEMAFLGLCRLVRSFRRSVVYHVWAVSMALLAGFSRLTPGVDSSSRWTSDGLLAASIVLSTLLAYALVDAVLLQRPWKVEAKAILPKLGRDALRLMLFLGACLFVATRILQLDISAVIVSSTVLSAVIGFALQDVLREFFAGISLELERPFQVGDWVILEGQQTQARIYDITWRSTHLMSPLGERFIEPNTRLAGSRVVNLGSGKRPVAREYQIGLRYDVAPVRVQEALEAAVLSTPGFLERPAPQVMISDFGESAIIYTVRAWTREVGSPLRLGGRLRQRIWYQLQRRGLQIPYPIRTLELHSMDQLQASRQESELQRVIGVLRRVELFCDLDDANLQRLAIAAEHQHFGGEEVLVREGAAGDSLMLIERGRVRIEKGDRNDPTRTVRVRVLEAGSFFGELSLLTGEPRSATIVADGDCEVLVLSKDSISPLIHENPTLAETLSRTLARRREATEASVDDHMRRRSATVEQTQATLLDKIRGFFARDSH